MSLSHTWKVIITLAHMYLMAQNPAAADYDYIPKEDLIAQEVIVVGGGMAGMAAARKLTNQGYSVRVFEARPERYGGRIWVDRKSMGSGRGAEGSLGAMFLKSGVPDNPLIQLAKDLELEMTTLGPAQLHMPSENKVYKGEELSGIMTDYLSVMKKILGKVANRKKDIHLPKFLESVMSSAKFGPNTNIIKAMINSNQALSMLDHSTLLFDPEENFGYDTVVLDGFDHIMDGIVGGVGSELPLDVELQTVVKQIEVDKKRNKVLVRTDDRKQHVADKVIVAVSLGSWHQRKIAFEPLIPRTLRIAISSIGIISSNKVILGFDESFWPSDVGVFSMVSEDKKEAGLLQTWINLEGLVGKPWLMGGLIGEAAKDFELMNDSVVQEKALNVLSKYFGEKVKERKVTKMIRSSWQKDEFTMGSISYPKTGSFKDLQELITVPVCPHIYIAGEFAHYEHRNSVLGAYLSGLRAADQIIDDYCTKQEKEEKEKESSEKTDTSTEEPKKTRLDRIKEKIEINHRSNIAERERLTKRKLERHIEL